MYVTWKPKLKWTYHSLKASSSNISKLSQKGAPRCTAPPYPADELSIVTVPSDWVKVLNTLIAPAAEQMLWLSAKELKETLTFIASRWSSKIENTWKHCSTWQVNWKSKFSAWYQHRFFSAAIWLFATSSLKDLYKEALREQIHQTGCT